MRFLILLLIIIAPSTSIAILPPIVGGNVVCIGRTMTLSDSTPGGYWLSSDTLIAKVSPVGVVHGMLYGTATITYSLGTEQQTKTIKVSPSPIFGSNAWPYDFAICALQSITLYDTTPGGGHWDFYNSGGDPLLDYYGSNIAIVTSFSIHGGTGALIFTDTFHCAVSTEITAYTLPFPPITGDTIIDVGATTILHEVIGPPFTWLSSDTTVATIDMASGLTTGKKPGTTTISCKMGCTVTTNLKVKWADGITPLTAAPPQITVFPNPASTELTINSTEKMTSISISDVFGRTIEYATPDTQVAKLDVSKLPPGLYFAKLNGGKVVKFAKE